MNIKPFLWLNTPLTSTIVGVSKHLHTKSTTCNKKRNLTFGKPHFMSSPLKPGIKSRSAWPSNCLLSKKNSCVRRWPVNLVVYLSVMSTAVVSRMWRRFWDFSVFHEEYSSQYQDEERSSYHSCSNQYDAWVNKR